MLSFVPFLHVHQRQNDSRVDRGPQHQFVYLSYMGGWLRSRCGTGKKNGSVKWWRKHCFQVAKRMKVKEWVDVSATAGANKWNAFHKYTLIIKMLWEAESAIAFCGADVTCDCSINNKDQHFSWRRSQAFTIMISMRQREKKNTILYCRNGRAAFAVPLYLWGTDVVDAGWATFCRWSAFLWQEYGILHRLD